MCILCRKVLAEYRHLLVLIKARRLKITHGRTVGYPLLKQEMERGSHAIGTLHLQLASHES